MNAAKASIAGSTRWLDGNGRRPHPARRAQVASADVPYVGPDGSTTHGETVDSSSTRRLAANNSYSTIAASVTSRGKAQFDTEYRPSTGSTHRLRGHGWPAHRGHRRAHRAGAKTPRKG